MTFSVDLLQAEPEVLGKALALERLHGMASRYVRVRNKGVTIQHVVGQAESARQCGAREEEILDKIRKEMTDPPYSDPDRVDEIRRRFWL